MEHPLDSESMQIKENYLWTQAKSPCVVWKIQPSNNTVGFTRSHADHSIFSKQWDSSSVIPIVYVDDILVTRSDSMGVEETKQHLKKCFVIKDLD